MVMHLARQAGGLLLQVLLGGGAHGGRVLARGRLGEHQQRYQEQQGADFF